MRRKFVFGASILLMLCLFMQAPKGYANPQNPQPPVLNYTPINLPGVPPLPLPMPSPNPPRIGPGSLVPAVEEDDVPDPEDEGSEDEIDVTESGTICLSPECLDDVEFSPLSRSQSGAVDSLSAALLQQAFDQYANSKEVSEMIEAARKHIRDNPRRYIRRVKGRKNPVTLCYRAVKDAMRASGMVPTSFQGGAQARAGVGELERVGFTNLLDNPEVKSLLENNPIMAPKGTILVYETAPGARASVAGHIEIKTQNSGQDGYISISETNRPTYGYIIPQVRRLIGVMYKPALASPPEDVTDPAP
jgi:hypothetical protein